MDETFDIQVGNSYNISKLLAKIFKYLEDNTIYAEKIKEVIDSDYSIDVTPIQGKVEIKISNEYTNQLKDTTKSETLQAINGSESIDVTQEENNIVISLNEDLVEKINNTISANLENVVDLFEGSDTIIVELNDKNDKIVIELDDFFKNTLATQDDIEQLEQEILALQSKQNKIVSSEEIVIDDETNELMLNNTLSNKINKSLVTPVSAPSEVKLVGVDTTNSQQMYGIGDGLSIENGKLKANGDSGGSEHLYKHSLNINNEGYSSLTFLSKTDSPLIFDVIDPESPDRGFIRFQNYNNDPIIPMINVRGGFLITTFTSNLDNKLYYINQSNTLTSITVTSLQDNVELFI